MPNSATLSPKNRFWLKQHESVLRSAGGEGSGGSREAEVQAWAGLVPGGLHGSPAPLPEAPHPGLLPLSVVQASSGHLPDPPAVLKAERLSAFFCN